MRFFAFLMISLATASAAFLGNFQQCTVPSATDQIVLAPRAWSSTTDFVTNLGFRWTPTQFNDRLNIQNPDGSGAPGAVRVKYGPGTGPSTSGISFYGFPGAPYSGAQRMELAFEVWFPSDFAFVKEGKLPGLWGSKVVTGLSESDCGGGVDAGAAGCFSVRGLWRSSTGAGALYNYLVHNQVYCNASDSRIICDPKWGDIVGRNFDLLRGAWNRLRIVVDLTGGIIQLYQNEQLQLSYRGVNFDGIRSFNGIKFETFFGGNTADFNSPTTQYAFFRNFKLVKTVDTPQYGACGSTSAGTWKCTNCVATAAA